MMNANKKKRLRLLLCALAPALIAAFAVAPLPTPEKFHARPYQFGRQDYERRTTARLQNLSPLRGRGELQIGVGVRNIDPEIGQPLMGFVDSGGSEGVASPSFVKALTVKCGDAAVTIVAADLMLWLPELSGAVAAAAGLTPAELYFTASHTHHSVGGWARGWIEEFFYGKFSPRYFDRLVASAAAAIKESRARFTPAKIGYRRAATNLLQNRIYPDERSAREVVEALIFRRRVDDAPLATLMTFAAHPTTVPRELHQASADYPGAWRDYWEKEFGGTALFAAGYVGDARPRAALNTRQYGEKLGELLLAAPETPVEANDLASLCLPAASPTIRLPLGAEWRWLPFIVPCFFPEETHLSALRLGDAVLLGFPADVAGELAPPLERGAARKNRRLMLTSFNGDWRGYFLTADSYLQRKSYERSMGLSGAEAGEYFGALGELAMEKLAAP
ncbi:MAG: hypothetical protein LBP75_11320 [Planctomycetota bacterium]|jgi:hypothetical protein|nr:hypothetical protein [Planctomycetota bacterium]